MDEIHFFMEESLVSVEPTASIREAAQKMRHHSISSILISENENLRLQLEQKYSLDNIISHHYKMAKIFELVEAVGHVNHLYATGKISRTRREDGAWLWQAKDG